MHFRPNKIVTNSAILRKLQPLDIYNIATSYINATSNYVIPSISINYKNIIKNSIFKKKPLFFSKKTYTREDINLHLFQSFKTYNSLNYSTIKESVNKLKYTRNMVYHPHYNYIKNISYIGIKPNLMSTTPIISNCGGNYTSNEQFFLKKINNTLSQVNINKTYRTPSQPLYNINAVGIKLGQNLLQSKLYGYRRVPYLTVYYQINSINVFKLHKPKTPYNKHLIINFYNNLRVNDYYVTLLPFLFKHLKVVNLKIPFTNNHNPNCKYSSISLSSRVNINFILSNIGLFLLKNFTMYINFIKFKNLFLYKFRKNKFTFPKPNQIKNLIIRRKSSLVLYITLFRRGLNTASSYPYTLLSSVVKIQALSNFTKYYSLNNTQRGFIKDLFKKDITSTTLTANYKLGLTHVIPPYNTEFKINRIRFKPGYQRLWREARSALKDLLGLKFIYQKQLTKYLVRFYKKVSIPFFAKNELKFYKVTIYSQLIPDYNTFNLFFNSNLFFLNGLPIADKGIVCVVNDFVQLIVSK